SPARRIEDLAEAGEPLPAGECIARRYRHDEREHEHDDASKSVPRHDDVHWEDERCPAENKARAESDQGCCKLRSPASGMRRAVAPPEPEGNEGEKGSADAESCRDTPVGLVRYWLAKAKFGFPPAGRRKPPKRRRHPIQKGASRGGRNLQPVSPPTRLVGPPPRHRSGHEPDWPGREAHRHASAPRSASPPPRLEFPSRQ